MKKLGAAIIGCGAVSKNHAEAITKNDNAKLLYCVDTKLENAKSLSQRYTGKPITNYKDLYEADDVDIVHICTPHFTHPEIAIDMLNNGKDVFLEKPLAILPSDAQEIINAAERNNRYLGVCFQNRLNDSTIAVKKIIESKMHGDIKSVIARVAWDRKGDYYSKSAWRGQYATEGGGCIINQSIHTIDLLDYLCGDVSGICAIATKFRQTDDYEVDDSCMANFEFKSGISGVGHFTNCFTLGKIAEIRIIMDKAEITLTQKNYCIEIDGVEDNNSCIAAKGEKSEWGISHGKLINEFYSCVIAKRPFFVDGLSALKAVKIVDAMKKSAGKLIEI